MALKTDLVSLGAIGTGAFIAVAATGVLLSAQSRSGLHEADDCMMIAVSSAPNIAIDLSAARGAGSNRVVVAPNVRVSRNASCVESIAVSEVRADEIRIRVEEARAQLEEARVRIDRDRVRLDRDMQRLDRLGISLGEDFMEDLTEQLSELEIDLGALELGDLDIEELTVSEMELNERREFLESTIERLSGNNDAISERVREALERQVEQLNEERAEGNGGTGR